MGDQVPIIIGHAGLVGRQQIVRVPDLEPEGEAEPSGKPMPSGAMPGNCRRVLSSPLSVDRGGGCGGDCQGRQRDGGCLLDVIRAAQAAGIQDWRFQIDPVDRFWEYAGPPIPGYDPSAPLAEAFTPPPAPLPSYDCPHCHAHVEQDLLNFHYWCPDCGRNAKET